VYDSYNLLGDMMFKKFFEIIGFIFLVGFSFFYTEKALTVVKEFDPIMQKIYEVERTYNIEAIPAQILDDNHIIPGYNGMGIDIDKSYSNMKRLGEFNENMLVYKEQIPLLSINKIYDKYIISGNSIKGSVSLVFKVRADDDVSTILHILDKNNVRATFFIDGKWLENNIQIVEKIIENNNELANLGYDNEYDIDFFLWTNNKLSQITDTKPKYCYSEFDDNNILNICKNNKMHTIKPTITAYNYPYNTIKNDIRAGSIISFNINNNTIKELPTIISFIKAKGYYIKTLSSHLCEKHQ
jgi:peptidoglycan-N-acetylglucosamine deacetylase